MSAISAACQCGSIGRSDLRQCPEHFKIWKGDVRLTSVSRIASAAFGVEICKSCDGVGYDHKPECKIGQAIENAKNRGSECDRLFASYVMGTLDRIPAGTRTDVYDRESGNGLLQKLMKWYDRQSFKKVSAQVLLGGDDHGGMVDFIFDDMLVDLKCTSRIEPSSRLQVAGYSRLSGATNAMILHCTAHVKEARLSLITDEDERDWLIALEHYRMIQRRKPPKEEG